MSMRELLVKATLALVLGGCGGSAPPPESPATKTEASKPEVAPVMKDEAMKMEDDTPPPPEAVQAPLPCPGKDAKYWDTGAVKAERVTEDCTINGRKFKAGTLVEFDENGAIVE